MRFNPLLGAGLTAVMIAASASADFTGWSYEIAGTTTTPGPGFWAVRFYAEFSDPGDRLLSVIGADYSSFGDQQLYQNPFGSGVEPNPALIAVFPDLQWDSFVTIGHTTTVVGQPDTSLDPDGEWNPSGFTGGYFVPGDAPQGLAGFSLKVLFVQLTIQNPNPSALVGGTATLAWESADGGGTFFSEIQFSSIPPSPGVLALFAVAGAAGSRRRH